jgi:hypothetical protein
MSNQIYFKSIFIKDVYEKAIRTSISEKQEASSKSRGLLKGSELDEIAEAVRSSDDIQWHLSSHFSTAVEKVEKTIEEVETLQYSERKANKQ